MNGQLWESYERGEISRDAVLYTRFGRVFEHFGIDADGIAFEHDYRKELDEGHDLMEGAMELVQTLAPLYELYIVTNGTTETQYKRLGDSGLSPYFKDIFISGEIGSRKPMKAFFDHCFEKRHTFLQKMYSSSGIPFLPTFWAAIMQASMPAG